MSVLLLLFRYSYYWCGILLANAAMISHDTACLESFTTIAIRLLTTAVSRLKYNNGITHAP